jgi:hypothetical protein
MNGSTIAIDEGHGPRAKVTKIVGWRDGFAVLVPYHSARRGFLAKVPVDYSTQRVRERSPELTEYTADDRVKLSMHRDGFKQFSGENRGKIVSGREADGTPKGLGLQAYPPHVPLFAGPRFILLVWGLEEFAPLDGRQKATSILDERDFYYRDCARDDWNAYLLEFFIFTAHFRPHLRVDPPDRLVLPLWLNAAPGGGAAFDFRIVIGEQATGLLVGVIASRVREDGLPSSGFMMTGAGEKVDANGHGEVLFAQYPRPAGDLKLPGLDYNSGASDST